MKAKEANQFYQNNEALFQNVGNVAFQSRSVHGLGPMNPSPSKNNRKSPDQAQKSLKERMKLHRLSGVVNHPDVDPTKLTREQGLIITDYITQIKALEKEYDQQKALKQKIKEEQNMN